MWIIVMLFKSGLLQIHGRYTPASIYLINIKLLTFNIFRTFSVSIVNIEQVNAGWDIILKLHWASWHTLQSEPGPGPRPSKKVSLGPLEKASAMPKFTILVKNDFLINLRALISNVTIVFLNSSPKTLN